MPTKLEAALIMLNMAQQETDETRKAAILVGIHHTIRRKLHESRNKASRVARGLKPFVAAAIANGGAALSVESGTVAQEA